MKGVILAAGFGTRLLPLTKIMNKHLIPVYDQPMIHYPLHTLTEAGIKDILIISNKDHLQDFIKLLGLGSEGIKISYAIQEGAGGIPTAIHLAKDFVGKEKFVTILGDNILHGSIKSLVEQYKTEKGTAKILLHEVDNPEGLGVAKISNNKVISLHEKPKEFVSNLAIIGVYFFDHDIFDIIPALKPSSRGETEITDIMKHYLSKNALTFAKYDNYWIDAGTFKNLLKASKFIAERSI
ncbi:MAG: sugar phosphate nucleotidyltransferase [Nanoarchaeota archaeon]